MKTIQVNKSQEVLLISNKYIDYIAFVTETQHTNAFGGHTQ